MTPGPVPETPPGSCEVCSGPLRSDNRTGLCRRTAACNTERRRRELLRAATPRCLCSDPAHPGGRCTRPSCGCLEDRPDAWPRDLFAGPELYPVTLHACPWCDSPYGTVHGECCPYDPAAAARSAATGGGESWLDDLARASLSAAEAKFGPMGDETA